MSKKSDAESELLIENYIDSFAKLDEMVDRVLDENARQLATGDADEFGWVQWQPLKINTEATSTPVPAEKTETTGLLRSTTKKSYVITE